MGLNETAGAVPVAPHDGALYPVTGQVRTDLDDADQAATGPFPRAEEATCDCYW